MREIGVILSADKTQFIHVDDVEDVALPLYEGRMIGQFDFSQKGWVSGKGRTAVWRDIPFENKVIEPQFLMSLKDCQLKDIIGKGFKVSFMDVTSSTNTRTVIATFLNQKPCGHKAPTLTLNTYSVTSILSLVAVINSYSFDFTIRCRLGGQSLIWSVLEESCLSKQISKYKNILSLICAKLSLFNINYAPIWLNLQGTLSNQQSWYQLWAITPYERLRLRCILDAVIAELYGLEIEDFEWILRDCDHSIETMKNKQFYRTLDPKGFWRVDKEKDPEMRHTVLSLVAFHDLKSMGLEAFLNLNEGEGWMIPHTLTLADYGLGHDERAKHPQPVAERFSPHPLTPSPKTGEGGYPNPLTQNRRGGIEEYDHLRYYPWQLDANIEESWLECERHAQNLKKLLGDSPQPPLDRGEKTQENEPKNLTQKNLPSDPNYEPPTDLFGNPLQVDLFGNIVDDKPKKRRRI